MQKKEKNKKSSSEEELFCDRPASMERKPIPFGNFVDEGQLTLLLEIEGISKYTDLFGDQRNKRTVASALAHRPSGQGYALTLFLYHRRNCFLCPRRLNDFSIPRFII